jgi:SAM-dependent methyltransferase
VHEGAKEVLATDVGGPSSQALEAHRDYRTAGRVSHAALDATAMTYRNEFDVVVFKSVIGSIGGVLGYEGQVAALEGMHRALRPGGVLLWAENITSSPLHQAARRLWVPWGGQWRYLTLAELRSLLSPFASTDWSSAGFTAAFGRKESHRRLLGAVDSVLFEWVVPRPWNYIAFGVSRKATSTEPKSAESVEAP